MARRLPPWTGKLVIAGWFGALLWLERRAALRRSVEPKLVRNARNMAVAATGSVVIQALEMPLVRRLASLVERRRWGLLPRLHLPRKLETALAVVLLDYTLYLWHVLTHRVPFLWRFHQVHHLDLDLDTSTAVRFHFGELGLSVAFRSAQVLLIGTTMRALSLWQELLLMSILFHHSNVRLPLELERRLAMVIMTPRLHGIHHSAAPDELSSNWSSGLTVWDWLHGTLRTDVRQDEIRIGIEGFERPEQVQLPEILALPFQDQGEVPGPEIHHQRQSVAHLRG
jgi:sterol desaturase/sphingolipid hydroxylase (fatty acid hydroxylase superfamily)